MSTKVISHFRVTRDGLIPLSPEESPPFPKQVTYVEDQPPEIQAQINAMVEQRADALLKAWANHTPLETGWLTVTIQESDERDPDNQRIRAQASKLITGMAEQDPGMYERFQEGGGFQPTMTLAKMRERIGGNEGQWIAPQVRQPVPISLRAWDDADPETTRLQFSSALLITWEDLEIPTE